LPLHGSRLRVSGDSPVRTSKWPGSSVTTVFSCCSSHHVNSLAIHHYVHLCALLPRLLPRDYRIVWCRAVQAFKRSKLTLWARTCDSGKVVIFAAPKRPGCCQSCIIVLILCLDCDRHSTMDPSRRPGLSIHFSTSVPAFASTQPQSLRIAWAVRCIILDFVFVCMSL
jgi:hypothetical protein